MSTVNWNGTIVTADLNKPAGFVVADSNVLFHAMPETAEIVE